MNDFLTLIIAGIALGCTYGIIGLSFTAIYNASTILNFAQGDFAMIGGVVASLAIYHLGLPLGVAIASALLVALLCSLGIQHVMVEPLLQRKAGFIPIVIGTLAVGFILEGAFGGVVGYGIVKTARYASTTPLAIGGLTIPSEYIVIIAATVLITIAYWYFLEKTVVGTALRATGQNPTLATCVGISTKRIRSLAFAISAIVAAIAGFLLAPLISANVFMGFSVLINGMIASVIGGIARPYAALTGGIILGLTASFVGGYTTGFVQLAMLAILITVLTIRPQGIFGEPG